MSTRDQIVEAADGLFYEQGFAHTSFADVAGAVGISRGNFYYHFRTKDEILDAVIARRVEATRAMLARWEEESGDPAGRIRCFIRILVANGGKIAAFGCPVGSLTAELAKLGHAAQAEAGQIFTLFRDWLRAQFEALGFAAEADGLAMYLLSRSQGAAVLGSAFRDEAYLRREADDLCAWLDAKLSPTRKD